MGREREELDPGPSSLRRPGARGQCGPGESGMGSDPGLQIPESPTQNSR